MRAKIRFASDVNIKDIRAGVSLGKWRWTEERPRPSWNCLKAAPLWTEPAFESVRSTLTTAPTVVLKSAADDKMPTATLPDKRRTASIFNATESTIPKHIANAKARGLIALVNSTEMPLSPTIIKHAEITPLMLFGTEECVDAALVQLRAFKITNEAKIRVYVRPVTVLPQDHRKLLERMVCLVAPSSTVLSQVCSCGCCPPGPDI